MTSNIVKSSSVKTAGTDLSLTTIEANVTQAATVTYDFIVNVTSGCLSGKQFEGYFSYDSSTLRGIGSEEVGAQEGLSINFEFLDVLYTEANDLDFSLYPRLLFEDGNLAGLDFEAFNNGVSYQIIRDFGNRSSFFSYLLQEGETTRAGSGSVTYILRKDSSTPVPEPNLIEELNVLDFDWLLEQK
ncbi:MAG TPA: hypothetical protein V6D14_10685 [Coleofasciculaceae cyanobacterium]|jgi:hypothetical protein